MRRRLFQVLGLLLSLLGWVFVASTVAMDQWRTSRLGEQGGSNVIKVAWYWSDLWKDCYSDAAAVTNCRDFPALWSVTAFIQGVRGLLLIGLALGFFGVLSAFVGMECTYIGGSEQLKDKILFAGSLFHFVGGLSDGAGFCLYINRIGRADLTTSVQSGNLRYGIGMPIFLGLVGSVLILLGALLYVMTVYRSISTNSEAYPPRPYTTKDNGRKSLHPNSSKPPIQHWSPRSGSSSNSKTSRNTRSTSELIPSRDAFV